MPFVSRSSSVDVFSGAVNEASGSATVVALVGCWKAELSVKRQGEGGRRVHFQSFQDVLLMASYK